MLVAQQGLYTKKTYPEVGIDYQIGEIAKAVYFPPPRGRRHRRTISITLTPAGQVKKRPCSELAQEFLKEFSKSWLGFLANSRFSIQGQEFRATLHSGFQKAGSGISLRNSTKLGQDFLTKDFLTLSCGVT